MPISSFYLNRDWKDEFYRDAWCKTCVNEFVTDEKSLKDYCEYNCRAFVPRLYDNSIEIANKAVLSNVKYKESKDEKEKEKIFFAELRKYYFTHMGMRHNYVFTNYVVEYDENKNDDDSETSSSDNKDEQLNYGKKEYSVNWCGYYTKGELKYLDNYFSGLQQDFKLENSAYIDYAKKVCKASLAMDKAFADMLGGQAGAERRYKDAKDIFDQLSQSAKFAEKTRSENDSVGISSLGELTKRLELTGFLQTKITFEKDDIDKIQEDYRWILTSVGEEF